MYVKCGPLIRSSQPMLTMLAAGIRLVSVFGVTAVFNVPLDTLLDGMQFATAAAL